MDARTKAHHALTAALFLGGVYLLVALAREIGFEAVAGHARALAWFVPAGLAIHVAVHAENTLGWRYAIGPEAAKVSFWRLFGAWAAGDLVNWGTPGSFGGEVLRAHLVRDRVPMSAGIASVTVARLSQSLSQFAFVGAGVALAWTRLDLRPLERAVIVTVVVGGTVFLGGIYLLQRTSTFGYAVRGARRLGLRGRLVDRVEAAIHRVDTSISEYHRDSSADFGRSVLWFLAGWTLQLAEVPLILIALDAPVDLRAVLAVESLAVFVESLAFLVPGKVGVDEGGRVLIFRALGHAPALGFGFSMFRRARELVWFSVCFAILVALKRRTDRAIAGMQAALAPAPPVAPPAVPAGAPLRAGKRDGNLTPR